MSTVTSKNAEAFPQPEADVYAAAREFVLAYALPALATENVFPQWPDNAAFPEGTEGFAVISVVSVSQHGTTLEGFQVDEADAGMLTLQGLLRISVRLEFCGDGNLSRQRAQRLAVAARSSAGVRFFTDRGMSALYADDVREQCFTDESKQHVRTYAVTLHVSLWSGVCTGFEYFDTARVSRLENIDEHHPVTQE